jgi:hypothetical protein
MATYDDRMELLPESREALMELVAMEAPDLDEKLVALGRITRSMVPELVALSLTVLDDGVTFTLVAPNSAVAAVDAVQYAGGGPCVDPAGDAGEPTEVRTDELLDEGRWSMFARASAAAGIASTLSLSLADEAGRVTGGINLYGSTPDAFDGRHEALARALGATAHAVVRDADLPFGTRDRARAAPGVLRDQLDVDAATGLLAAAQDLTIDQARDRLRRAAEQAGVDVSLAARVIVLSHRQ